jgi:hypothetical protein
MFAENVNLSIKGKLVVNDSLLTLITTQTIQFKYNLLSDSVNNNPIHKYPLSIRTMVDRTNPNIRFKLFNSTFHKNKWYFTIDLKDDFGKVISQTFLMKKRDD